MRRQFGWLLVGLVIAEVIVAASITASAEPANPRRGDESLMAMNQEFRATYARARADLLRQAGPLLLYDGEKLVLIRGEQRQEGTRLPAVYDRLKVLCHLPFTVYLELRSATTAPLDDAARGRVAHLRELIAAVERDLPQLDFAPGEPDRQRRIVAASLAYVDAVLAQGRTTPAELDAFAKRLTPELEANLTAAAAVELGHYHRQLRDWNLTPDEWSRLRVVVQGSQMPRREHRVVQLAAGLLGVPGEGLRIVYAEALYEEQRAVNLLGTHLLDAESAAAFFGDPTRLDRDILAAGAAKYVRENVTPTR